MGKSNTSSIVENTNFFLASHHLLYGPTEALEKYLTNYRKARKLAVLYYPLFKTQREKRSFMKIYENGELLAEEELSIRVYRSDLINHIQHFASTAFSALGMGNGVFIGTDPLLATSGIIARNLGIADCLVYYSHNFQPELGTMYRVADLLSTQNSTIVWCLSRKLSEIRKELGARKVITVPVGVEADAIREEPREMSTVIFASHLHPDKGSDVILKSIPTMLRKNPESKIIIVGSGPRENSFRDLASKHPERIELHKPMPYPQLMRMISKATVGLAPYKPSREVLTTDPSKPKLYLSSHVPVVVSDFLEISEEVKRYGAGEAVRPKPNALEEAVSKILRDPDPYIQGAAELAIDHCHWDWRDIFDKAFAETFSVSGVEAT